jgi:hypothetical protein
MTRIVHRVMDEGTEQRRQKQQCNDVGMRELPDAANRRPPFINPTTNADT